MNVSKSRPSPVAGHVAGIPGSGIREFFDIVATCDDVISLGIGEPDFETPWHIREAAMYNLERGVTSYTSNLGVLELREKISDYVKRSYHVKYDPVSEIMITTGVSEAYDLAIRALVEPGDEVLYHEPCYVAYAPVVTLAHGKPVAVTTRCEENFRVTRRMLEEKATARTKALLLNFPTNPTGATLSRKDVEAIAGFVMDHDIIVIADDIYSELTYEGERVSIASVPGMRERTIFLNGFSKAWAMTGFRLGFACAPPELTDAMMRIHQYTMLCAPTMAQHAAIEALDKDCESDIGGMRDEYKRRRNFIHSALNGIGLPCFKPHGAFYAFPYVGGYGLSSRDFSLRLLEEEKVACVPGTAFGECGEGFLRCSYATGMHELKEAMTRMGRFVARLKKRK